MAAPSRGGQALSALMRAHARAVPSRAACARCSLALAPRRYSAAASPSSSSPSQPAAPPPPATSPPATTDTDAAAAAHPVRIRAGIVLSRPPLLTREPSPFEAAFYLYQKRLNERLSGSFRKNVYFKPDTTPAIDWRLQLRDRRGTPARDIGIYHGGKGRGAGATAWDDEITLDDPLAAELTDPVRLRERIIADADSRVSEDGVRLADADRIRVERPLPRTTAADGTADTPPDPRRLDRALDRTLYLVVRGADGVWSFPTADVQTNEALHETAARALEAAAGVDMNTWIVGRVPIAHIVESTPAEGPADSEIGEKTFFIKGRIMAGQANLANNTLNVTDFKWLTKEELKQELPASYYAHVKNAMPSR